MKVGIICLPGLDNFIRELVSMIEEHTNEFTFDINSTGSLQHSMQTIAKNEVIWIEWANEVAIRLTTMPQLEPVLATKKVILRMHSYELFSGMLPRINWKQIDKLCYVATHVRTAAGQQIMPKPEIYVIPNPIDTDKFELQEKPPEPNICVLGYINHKKSPDLALQAFLHIMKEAEGYHDARLFFAGDVQDARYVHYLKAMTNELGLEDEIFLDKWPDNLVHYLADKTHVLCTSPWESQNISVMQAMATGSYPLVTHFPGAIELYPNWSVWTDFHDLINCCPKDHSEWAKQNRDFVNYNYSKEKVIPLYIEMIKAEKQPVETTEEVESAFEGQQSIEPV